VFVSQVVTILVKSLRNSSGDNIALLLKQVDVIARFYQDRLIALQASSSSSSSSSSEGGGDELRTQYDRLQVVAQAAQQVLTGLIKTQENVQPYLGTYLRPYIV
jgi:hypothetical protein